MTLREYLLKTYSKSTLKSNLYGIQQFVNYARGNAQKATYRDVLGYVEYLRKNLNLHPKTLKHRLYAVKIYFNYLLEMGVRTDHPCRELFLKDKVCRDIAADTLHSSKSLQAFYDSHQAENETLLCRNRVILSLLMYQALTVREITDVRVSQVDLKKGEILVEGLPHRNSKSPQSRTLPLQAKQILLLHGYLTKARKKLLSSRFDVEDRLILGNRGTKMHPHHISKLINEGRPKAECITPLKIRQSVIANLLKKQHDTRVVQVFAGHRTTSTTVQYRLSDLELLQKAVNEYHPIR